MKINYNKIVLDNPNLSSFTCFVKTIKSRHLPLREITRWFNELVDKQDYRRAEKEAILTWLKTV